MLRRWWVFAVLWLALAAAVSAKERVWTTSDGRTMRGEFVRELDGEVTLLVDGKLATVPLDRLSERDQQAARALAAGKEAEDDPALEPVAGGDVPAAEKPAPADPPPPLLKKPRTPVSRVWTDDQGRKTTGKFVRVFGGSVVISRAGGPITVPFFSLSEADQQYVKDLLTERGEEEMIPTPPPPPSAATGDGDSGPNPAGQPPSAVAPIGGGPGPRPGPSNPPGYDPPGGYDPAGGQPASGEYSPGGYDAGDSSFMDEHQRRSDAAQRQADRAMQETQDRIDRMAQRASQPMFERVPVCSNCQSRLSDAEAQGTRCPRCGARWVYNQYGGSSAGSSATSSGNRSGSGIQLELLKDPETKRAVFGGVVIVVVLAVVLAVVIGVIAVAMAIASASKAGRRYQQ